MRVKKIFRKLSKFILADKKTALPLQSQILRVEAINKYVTAYQNKTEILRPQPCR